MRFKQWGAIAAILGFQGMGCRLVETPQDPAVGEVEGAVPAGFRVSSLEPEALDVEVRTLAGDLYPGAQVRLMDAKGRTIEVRPTGEDGRVGFRAAAPTGMFLLRVEAVGVPSDTVVVGTGERLVVIPRPPQAPAATGGKGGGVVLAREVSWSTAVANSQGVPAGLDSSRRWEVSGSFLGDVNFAFPESRPVPTYHPEYLQQGAAEEIFLTDSAQVWLTFLHEGAGYRNSFGCYVVPPGAAISSAAALDKRILLPNASLRGSGGNLVSGDRVRVGAFPAGTRIGFFLVADGWNGSRVDTSGAKPIYYSRAALNPESDPIKRRHLALLLHEATGKAVMGFEDLNRGGSGCDNDFNDALFTVSWTPEAAIHKDQFVPLPGRTDSDGDGVADNLDEFPADPVRAYSRWFPAKDGWGTLAFEDLWPSSGDYDFNDLVARYNVQEIRSANLSTVETQMRVVPVAAGAQIRNGIAVGLGKLPAAPSLVEVKKGSQIMASRFRRDPATGEAVVRLTRDVLGEFPGGEAGLVNTRKGSSRLVSDTLRFRLVLSSAVDLPEPPYDPFLFRTADTTLEIHLPDRSPTRTMRRTLFRTRDDRTDSVAGSWYRDVGRLPWGLNLSEDWKWPLEGEKIQAAYPRFRPWVASAGRADLDWYLHPVAGKVIEP